MLTYFIGNFLISQIRVRPKALIFQPFNDTFDVIGLAIGDIEHTDLNWREVAIFAPLIAATLYMGLQPNSVFDLTAASVDQLVQTYQAAIGGAHP